MQGDSLNVMSNRTKISALSKIFQEIDYFLFDYNAENETLLDINKYELKDFPVLIIVFKASNDICIINILILQIKVLWKSYQIFVNDASC